MVDADAEVRDEAEPISPCGDDLRAYPIAERRYEHVRVRNGAGQALLVQGMVGQIEFGVEQLGHAHFDRHRPSAGDNDFQATLRVHGEGLGPALAERQARWRLKRSEEHKSELQSIMRNS